MGIQELKIYKNYTKKLTENDKKGLRMLIEKEAAENGENMDVLRYMQEKGLKLEQEAVKIYSKSIKMRKI